MKKLLLTAMALIFVVSASTAYAQNQATLRIGGGVMTGDNPSTSPGGSAGLDIKLADKDAAFGLGVEFFSKSGLKITPVTVGAMYAKMTENEKATFFFGGGGGITNVSGTGGFTKFTATGTGGVTIHASPKVGLFVKGQYYRVFSTAALNLYSITGGIAFRLM